jgi:clostripain
MIDLMKKNYARVSVIVLLLMIASAHSSHAQALNGWTIMHYAVGSNSSESDLLADMDEMIRGKISDGYELITLIDRTEGFSEDSTTLGENFTDTRMYSFNGFRYNELNGSKALPEISTKTSFDGNMGDADLLKRFIQHCKAYYPAEHYMLILRSHGNGVSMCPDAESGTPDRLYPAELRDVLGPNESVDILGLDVCSMAGLENMYQWKPHADKFSADYLIASAPLSGAWAYDEMLQRLRNGSILKPDSAHFAGGMEDNMDPWTMTPENFTQLVLEELYDNQAWASWGAFDLNHIDSVKDLVDETARFLAKDDKDEVYSIFEESLAYFHNTSNDAEIAKLTFPYLDSYDFFARISGNHNLSDDSRKSAVKACEAIDNLVLYSYYGRGFLPETDRFIDNKSGAYIIAPLGRETYSGSGRSFWSHANWFHPYAQTELEDAYGKYDWCAGNAIAGDNTVSNFFELLDYLFDESNDENGGVNQYQW